MGFPSTNEPRERPPPNDDPADSDGARLLDPGPQRRLGQIQVSGDLRDGEVPRFGE